ncbi:MAG: hypothetical protein ACR2PI_22955 [Hyphomicrobiaceae bacterium]
MTTVHHTRGHTIGRIGIVLLSAVLCTPALLATSAAAQGTRSAKPANDARRTDRLAFTGSFRFRPAPIIVPKMLPVSSGRRTLINDPQERTRSRRAPRRMTQPRRSPVATVSRSAPPLSRATRSSLGAPSAGNATPETKPPLPVTAAAASPARSGPPLPTRLKRSKVKKSPRNTRPINRSARTAKRLTNSRATTTIKPPPSTIFDEPPPWARNALYKSN